MQIPGEQDEEKNNAFTPKVDSGPRVLPDAACGPRAQRERRGRETRGPHAVHTNDAGRKPLGQGPTESKRNEDATAA